MSSLKILRFVFSYYYFLIVAFQIEALSSQIPNHLRKCYDKDYQLQDLHQPPAVTKTLVELIRKLEHNRTEPNIRILSNAIFHVAKLDGIQNKSVAGYSSDNLDILPYRATGYQFIKHSLLVDHYTPDQSAILQFPPSLTNDEFCLLHFLISNTLDMRLRNDEHLTCSINYSRMTMKSNSKIDNRLASKGYEISDCPEQKGVIETNWGTISPGYIIAGIASAFQRTENELKTIADNVWMATLGGVLSQAIINQVAEHPRILSPGNWNDSLLPRKFYLKDNHWDINNADILGALDGLILADEVRKWYHEFPAVSLSQLIETYYSSRGVAYDRSVRACERGKKLAMLFEKYDWVREISAVTRALLQAGQYPHILIDNSIDTLTKEAVDQFKIAADSLIPSFEDCQEDKNTDNQPGRKEIILIADQAYSRYDMERIFSILVDAADVSYFSSSVGLIAGSSGTWLVNVTNDILQIYDDFSKISDNTWPFGLTLTNSLHTIISYYQNVSSIPCSPVDRPYGKVIVVLAPSSHLTDNDLKTSLFSLDSLYNLVPELRVIFVTSSSNAQSFSSLLGENRGSQSIAIVANSLQETTSLLQSELRKIPAGIINFFCNGSFSTYEDYVTPDNQALFEIHEKYWGLSKLSVKFRKIAYGDVSICAYNAKTPTNKTCVSTTSTGDEITFTVRDQCAVCTLHFAVMANNTLPKCTAFACRRPDQVLIAIRPSWSNRGSPTRMPTTSWSIFFLLSITFLLRR